MEIQEKKCSNIEHKDINVNSYCSKCEIYMCNKCQNLHSKLFNDHQAFVLEKANDEKFTGLCKEERHHLELQFFCKTHNQLCCALCLCKIKKESMGKHHDCDVCDIEDIKDGKINKLEENIEKLRKLSNSFEESINKLKEIYKKINGDKEELKLKIQKIFTLLRNELNNREDELLLKVDNAFNKAYFKEEIIKESEKLFNKIKLSLEKNINMLKKEYKENQINILINECVNIENNIKEIEYINENIKKYNDNFDNFKLKLSPEKEEELAAFLSNIKTFGRIFNSCMILYKWRKNQIKNNFTLSDNDKTIEINYSVVIIMLTFWIIFLKRKKNIQFAFL